MQVEFVDDGILVKYPIDGGASAPLNALVLSDDHLIICRSKPTPKDKNKLVNALINQLWKTKQARNKRYLK